MVILSAFHSTVVICHCILNTNIRVICRKLLKWKGPSHTLTRSRHGYCYSPHSMAPRDLHAYWNLRKHPTSYAYTCLMWTIPCRICEMPFPTICNPPPRPSIVYWQAYFSEYPPCVTSCKKTNARVRIPRCECLSSFSLRQGSPVSKISDRSAAPAARTTSEG